MKDLQKHVGKRIRTIREGKGISQETLADMCKLHRTYIGLIERGQRNLTIATIEVIARELGIPPAELFVDAETTFPSKRARTRVETIPVRELAAHVSVIRAIIIKANLVDDAAYDALVTDRQSKLPR